jgi:hypothetical protein
VEELEARGEAGEVVVGERGHLEAARVVEQVKS